MVEVDVPGLLIFVIWTDMVAFGAEGRAWRTPRISIDGIQNVRIEDGKIVGEAWWGVDDVWPRFELDPATGRVLKGETWDH